MQPHACQPRVMRCTRAAASARRSSPAAANMLSSSGSDSDETGSLCPLGGRSPVMMRAAGTDGIVMSARRFGSMTPFLPPPRFALGLFDDVITGSDDSSSSSLSGVISFDFISTRPLSAWNGSLLSDGSSPKWRATFRALSWRSSFRAGGD